MIPTHSRLAGICLAALAVLGAAPGAMGQTLEEVLGKQKNLTTFRDLVRQYSDVYDDLPSSGVTIIAPNDGAFVKGQGWDAVEDSIPVWLRYGILRGEVRLGDMSPGDTQTIPTLLDDSRYANVSDGQKVFVTMQPSSGQGSGDVVITSGVGTHITVVEADVPFDGGLVHIVESLPVTPRRLEPSIRDSYMDLTSFLGALYHAGLEREFAETPNVTIFAPHNSAFQRLAGVFDDMDGDEFRRVLRYHMVPDAVLRASDLEEDSDLDTEVDGARVHITRYINDIYVNTARVIQTDLLVANGIVQMIDSVLNVDEDDARPDVSQSVQEAVFTAAVTSVATDAPVPFTTALPCTTACSSADSRPTGAGDEEESGGDGDGNGARGLEGMGLGIFAGVVGMGVMGVV